MAEDRFFDLIGVSGIAWLGVAFGYAAFDYLYNLVMCSLTGGYQYCSRLVRSLKRRIIASDYRYVIQSRHRLARSFARQYKHGAVARVHEFRSDPLSWSWPITVLALTTVLYGLTRSYIGNVVNDLAINNIYLLDYRPAVMVAANASIQYLMWIMAIGISISSFYRYYKARSVPTWFSRSNMYSMSRCLIFNTPLTYMTFQVIFLWLAFSVTLYNLLSDDWLVYEPLAPDMLYGLKPAYDAILILSVFIIVFSSFSIVILWRERRQKYSWNYQLILLGGILSVLLITGFLVYHFDQRLGNIKENALSTLFKQSPALGISNFVNTNLARESSLVRLQAYYIIMQLPGGFPIPSWFSYIFSIRAILLLYEAYALLSVESNKQSFAELAREIIGKLKE